MSGVMEKRVAGLSLDREVIGAMGWDCIDGSVDRKWPRHVGVFDPTVPQFLALDNSLCRRIGQNRWDDFHPSETFAAAEHVLEAMRAKGWRCTMELLAHGESPYVFVAFHTKDQTPAQGHHALTETLARGICLAALRALEPAPLVQRAVESL